jgi:hypothetical protein
MNLLRFIRRVPRFGQLVNLHNGTTVVVIYDSYESDALIGIAGEFEPSQWVRGTDPAYRERRHVIHTMNKTSLLHRYKREVRRSSRYSANAVGEEITVAAKSPTEVREQMARFGEVGKAVGNRQDDFHVVFELEGIDTCCPKMGPLSQQGTL